MTTLYAYPRLSDGDCLVRLAKVRTALTANADALTELVEFEHPSASPVPTGATIADVATITNLRTEVLGALEGWMTGEPIPRRSTADFDRSLGAALHACARLLPADSAHQGTWNFLSAMVFPDVIWARFPDLHEERFLGRPRNALRRVWYRQDVLADLVTVAGPRGLGEDELVGLLERTSLARNRRLVRTAAEQVLKYSGAAPRSEWARDFYKRLTHQTGPLLLDVLTDEQLRELVQTIADGGAWHPNPVDSAASPARSLTDRVRHSLGRLQDTAGLVAAPKHRGAPRTELGTQPARRGKDSGDVVKDFHRAMVDLVAIIRQETDYNPTLLLRLINQGGGIAAAQKVAGTPDVSEGFAVLWEKGRLDLSVEALVLHPDYEGLFSHELRNLARSKLAQAGWDT